MSHRWGCPSDYEARGRARRDAEFDLSYGIGRDDYRRPYGCDEGNRQYRRTYYAEAERIEEDQRIERRVQQRREEERQEQAYREGQWAREEQERQEAAQYEDWLCEQAMFQEWAKDWRP